MKLGSKKMGKKDHGLKEATLAADGADAAIASLPAGMLERDQLAEIRKAMELIQLKQQQQNGAAQQRGAAGNGEDAAKKTYEFWSTQPVPRIDEDVTTNECIAPDVPVANIRQEPYSLPDGFQWDTLNLGEPLQVRPDGG